MQTYQTMTVGGLYGQRFQAETDQDAERQAVASGYEVLDVVEHGGELVLVVSD